MSAAHKLEEGAVLAAGFLIWYRKARSSPMRRIAWKINCSHSLCSSREAKVDEIKDRRGPQWCSARAGRRHSRLSQPTVRRWEARPLPYRRRDQA